MFSEKLLLTPILFIGIVTATVNPSPSSGEILMVNTTSTYGNDVRLRTSVTPIGAKKSWVDGKTMLPSGLLRKYFFFVHHATSADKSPVNIRLQIWEPSDTVDDQFKLRWQTIVQVDIQSSTGILYTYTLPDEENVQVEDGDRIGWTFEDDRGAISTAFDQGHKTYFRNVQNDVFPEVGQSYIFDNIHLPSIFSVAVEVTQVPTTPLLDSSSSSPPPKSSGVNVGLYPVPSALCVLVIVASIVLY